MDFLVDTHVFVWAISQPIKLDMHTKEILASAANKVFVSAVTPWEISIKKALGRLDFPLELLDEMMARFRFRALAIAPVHGIAAGALPALHRDPFDRMLIAQARIEDLTLVSGDQAILQYDVRLLRVSAG
jgi:PIN domain nuclease of toxin-antitoxin system